MFGGWDMCIEDETAAKLQFMRIVKDIEVRLIEPWAYSVGNVGKVDVGMCLDVNGFSLTTEARAFMITGDTLSKSLW